MAKKMISVRLDEALVEWLDEQPGSRTGVVEMGLLALRESPDEVVSVAMRVPRVEIRARPFRPLPPGVQTARDLMRAKQAKLNQARGDA